MPVPRPQPREAPVAHAQPREAPIAHAQPREEPVAHAQRREEPIAHAQPREEPVAHATADDDDADAGPTGRTAPAAAMPTIEPSPPMTVKEPEAAACQADPIAAVTTHQKPTETQVDPARLVELMQQVMAVRPVKEEPLPIADELETEPSTPADDGSWYELPVFAPAQQKKRDRPRTDSRKKTAAERRRSNADRLQTAASPEPPQTKTPQTAALEARTDKEPQRVEAIPPLLESPSKSTPMPSAKDILASHAARRRTQPAAVATKPAISPAAPTPAREPDQWAVPAWVAGPPATAFVLVVGLIERNLVMVVGRRFVRGRADERAPDRR